MPITMAGCTIGQFKQLIILPKFHPKMPNPDWFHPKPHRKSEPTINMQYVSHEQWWLRVLFEPFIVWGIKLLRAHQNAWRLRLRLVWFSTNPRGHLKQHTPCWSPPFSFYPYPSRACSWLSCCSQGWLWVLPISECSCPYLKKANTTQG